MTTAVAAAVAASASGGVATAVAPDPPTATASQQVVTDQAPDQPTETGVATGQLSVAGVAEAVSPAVAAVTAVQPGRGGAQGSAVVVEPDGALVTNHHVVAGAARMDVQFADRVRFGAELVGSEEASDLAVLRIDAEGLPVVPLADEPPSIGDTAAIGSPFASTHR